MVPQEKLPRDSDGSSASGLELTATIRRATDADAMAIAKILVEAWRAAYRGILDSAFLEAMDQDVIAGRWMRTLELKSSDPLPLVIEAQHQVVGFTHFGAARDAQSTEFGELYALNMLPHVWGRGFGSQLLAAATAELYERGYERVYLWVANGNTRANQLYERHGWNSAGITKQDSRFNPPLREHRYEKILGSKPVTSR